MAVIDRFPRTKGGRLLGMFALAVSIAMAAWQWPIYLRTGKTAVAFSSQSGTSYGPSYFLVFPILELAFAAYVDGMSSWIRVEISEEGIGSYGLFGRQTAFIPWSAVRTFRRSSQSAENLGERASDFKLHYRVEGADATVTLSGTTPRLSELIALIRDRLPASADNKIPRPK